MSEQKPLHVRVAEALKWTDCRLKGEFAADEWAESNLWEGAPHGSLFRLWPSRFWPIPRYDIDWAAMGPLIEKYVYRLERTDWGWHAEPKDWDGEEGSCGDGSVALIAVCNLILALKEAGKLDRSRL